MGNLATPKSVQKLQTALHAKAKAEAGYRFYALYDKISRDFARALGDGVVSLGLHDLRGLATPQELFAPA